MSIHPTFAIVPAAGLSRRMGRPKLLLPWPTKTNPDGRLIDRVLQAWTHSGVSQTVVVIRAQDDELAERCKAWPVRVLRADPAPQDMKASIQCAVDWLESEWDPQPSDRCFVAPADLPGLTAALIDRLLNTPADSSTIVVPQFGNHEGHPVLLPWSMVTEVRSLGEDQGLNTIVVRHPKLPVPLDASARIADVDTPEEYRSALARWETD